jgi:hypothetical protein
MIEQIIAKMEASMNAWWEGNKACREAMEACLEKVKAKVDTDSQVYALFTVLKCNLVFVFCCFFHYHFHATCFGNSLPSLGMVPLTISLQFIVRIDVKLKYKR